MLNKYVEQKLNVWNVQELRLRTESLLFLQGPRCFPLSPREVFPLDVTDYPAELCEALLRNAPWSEIFNSLFYIFYPSLPFSFAPPSMYLLNF